MKGRRWAAVVVAFVLLIAGLAAYTVWDDQRIVIRRQEIVIDVLPSSFDGYTILQISDLHGRVFGEGKSRLLEAINSVEHDIIALTGDMSTSMGRDGWNDITAVLSLVEGLHGQPMVWVDGNTGPFFIEALWCMPTGRLLNEGEQFEALGVHMLTEPLAITRGDDQIYFTPKLCLDDLEDFDQRMKTLKDASEDESVIDAAYIWHDRLSRWYEQLKGADEVLIAIDHYPQQRYLSVEIWPYKGHLDYDLMICGHNHGGQMRLPFIGAIYIPTISSERGGWFPEQQDVMGLQEICGIPQYVSAGLGASSSYGLLGFRFLCPPEIDMIILKCRE